MPEAVHGMDPSLLSAAILFSLLGAVLGCGTGAAPGIHVNTLCLLLTSSLGALLPAAASAAIWLGVSGDDAPILLACLIVSAAASHSFLDFLPSVFLGAPDEGDSLSTLPGHRLLLQGRGREAVEHAASGALVGGALAVALCVPLYFVLGPPLNLHPVVDSLSLAVVMIALALLVLSERGGEVVAEIMVRKAVRSARPLSLARPVPVHGEPVVIRGKVVRERWSAVLVTPTGRWRLRGYAPRGEVTVDGVWALRTHRAQKRMAAIALILLSGLLGLVVMDRRLPLDDLAGLDLSLMFPLLTGLFGVPTLLSSSSASLPPQQDAGARPRMGLSSLGALAGAAVGWFPGISSTTGVILVSHFVRKGNDAGGFIAMVSAVGTASAVFGILALAVAHKGRSGALLAVKDVLGGTLPFEQFPLLLAGVLVGCAVGNGALLWLGAWFARSASRIDAPRLNRAILLLLLLLTVAFNGVPGVLVLVASTILGMVPPAMGVGRVHLTGCLLVPVLLFLLDIRDVASAAL